MAARSAAAAAKRRLGGWCPRVSLGDGGAARKKAAARGERARATTACCFSARKRLLGQVSGIRNSDGVYNRYTAKHKHKLCLAESD